MIIILQLDIIHEAILPMAIVEGESLIEDDNFPQIVILPCDVFEILGGLDLRSLKDSIGGI